MPLLTSRRVACRCAIRGRDLGDRSRVVRPARATHLDLEVKVMVHLLNAANFAECLQNE